MPLRPTTTTWPPALDDDPRARGERLVAWLRMLIASGGIMALFAYLAQVTRSAWPAIHASGATLLVWGLLGALGFSAMSRGYYRPWISYVSILTDILAVTIIQIAFMIVLPLNSLHAPVTAFYFVVIGLAALRKSRALVIFSGFASGIVHLAVAFHTFRSHFPDGYALVELSSTPVEISFLDEALKSAAMAVVGWIVGYVTQDLRNSERHYRDFFDHVPDGIVITSRAGEILAVNRSFCEMTGLSRRDLLHRSIREILRTETRDRLSIPPPHGFSDEPTLLVRANGEEISVRCRSMEVEHDGQPCVEMSVRDVTEQVLLERQLAQSQKMETLGRLAGGLAHDVNNMLGGIIGAASLIERRVKDMEPARERERVAKHLQVIEQCGERARDVVGRLLSFARRTAAESRLLDLNRVLADVANICRNTFDRSIEIVEEPAAEPALVKGDGTALTQALLNLCINAKDAMPGGGRLLVAVKPAPAGGDWTDGDRPGGGPEAGWVVEVTDNGMGIEPHLLDKIFDPFFTTKPAGEGTGLGLSMVYNISRQHGGRVEVDSVPGIGTTFRLCIPRAPADEPAAVPARSAAPPLQRGRGTVLVIDDEEAVRSSTCAMLSELGYEAVAVSNGREALERLEEPGRHFDLVLLDMVMPGMDGPDLLRRMRETRLDFKVLVTSGFWTDEQARSLGGEQCGFLRKPFSFSDLATRLGEVLGTTPDRPVDTGS